MMKELTSPATSNSLRSTGRVSSMCRRGAPGLAWTASCAPTAETSVRVPPCSMLVSSAQAKRRVSPVAAVDTVTESPGRTSRIRPRTMPPFLSWTTSSVLAVGAAAGSAGGGEEGVDVGRKAAQGEREHE
jgi:hypothetical protein